MTPTANITAHKSFDFLVDPYQINWGYNLRTHNDDTYGGKVVQILGVDLTTLTINTVAGSGGFDYVNKLMIFFRDMCLWQQDTGKLATFSYPFKNYFLNVWGLTINYQDMVGNVVYPINMTFNIQDDIAGTLKKTAMTAELNRLAEGIGYTRSVYNYPTPSDIAAFDNSLANIDTSATPVNTTTVTGIDSSLTAEQQSNAAAIIGVALSQGFGIPGAEIGIMVSLQESSLINVNHGDASGPSSIGLFQQMPGWGSLPQRTDPQQAATLFYTAHNGYGANGLAYATPRGQTDPASYVDWKTKQPWIAGADVELVGDGGVAYQTKYAQAQSIVAKLTATTTGTSGGTPVVNGVSVTIPQGHPTQDVPPEVAGQTISAPNAAVAKGIAAGLAYLDTPYVWGGGDGIGGGPDHGSRDGNNNPLIGFDCSGLAGYVVGQMGFHVAGGNSFAQNAGGTQVPYTQALPGDLVGYDGHVAIYLGIIGSNVSPYLLEAPETGKFVQIKQVYSYPGEVRHPNVARYWS